MKTNELILASKNIFEEILKSDLIKSGLDSGIKDQILSYINLANEELENNPDLIVGYTTSGEPLTKEMLITKVKDVEKGLKAGTIETFSSEEVLERIKKWG